VKVLVFALLLLSSGTWAEWTRVADDDTAAGYVDLATVRKQGNSVKMWSLLDYKTIQRREGGPPYLSLTTQFEYNCYEQRSRMLALTVYSENMGRGEVVIAQTFADRPWEAVQPGTRSEMIWEIACKQ
jgi:hypothetical protein